MGVRFQGVGIFFNIKCRELGLRKYRAEKQDVVLTFLGGFYTINQGLASVQSLGSEHLFSMEDWRSRDYSFRLQGLTCS